MNARLGFAVAAHLEPDVLIIDEVLSVGDTSFQAKCLERMRSFKQEGVAIVFVSHNMHAIADLCDDALQLDGAVVSQGAAGDVVRDYLAGAGRKATAGSGPVQLASLGLSCADGAPASIIAPGTRLRQLIEVIGTGTISDCSLTMIIRRSTDNLLVFERWYPFNEVGIPMLAPGDRHRLTVDFTAHLLRGLYQVYWRVYHHPTTRYISTLATAGIFQVDEDTCHGGVADLEARVARVP